MPAITQVYGIYLNEITNGRWKKEEGRRKKKDEGNGRERRDTKFEVRGTKLRAY